VKSLKDVFHAAFNYRTSDYLKGVTMELEALLKTERAQISLINTRHLASSNLVAKLSNRLESL
jgi:hypothetical protein